VRVIVTAGPTVEDIDDVRFLSNRSSGRLGYAIAERFASLGHKVALISGPVCLECPPGIERLSVRSCDEMAEAVWNRLPDADVVVMAAAVADFKPATRVSGKIKKTDKGLTLRLVKTVDILAGVGERHTARQTIVGFALEAGGPDDPASRKSALDKMARKHLDAIVLNSPENIGATRGEIVIIGSDGEEIARASGTKEELAKAVVDAAIGIHGKGHRK
jgi:phosphopantothenoylcysteine decarboxylase/phosphopantothenate--cysteine ligase